MSTPYALLPNPKTGELVIAYRDDLDMDVYDADDELVGEATLQNYGREYNECQETTGYTRGHCPKGVRPKLQGMGFGTVIYTALVAATYQGQKQRWRRFRLPETGEGICSSPGTRSQEADAWWDAAVGKFGIAKREEDSSSYEQINDSGSSCTCTCSRICDTYTMRSARKNNLIVALFHGVSDAEYAEDINDTGDWIVESKTALAALDLRAFRERVSVVSEGAQVFSRMVLNLAAEELSKPDFEALFTRFVAGVSYVNEELDPRPNPRRKRRTMKTLRTRNGIPYVQHPIARPNPTPTQAEVERALERQAELFKKNGWDKFADDPGL